MRYELYPPATPRKPGGFVSYNPANNQLVLAGEDGNPSNIGMQTSYRNVAPRLGVSYRKCSSVLLTLTGVVVASAALARSGHRKQTCGQWNESAQMLHGAPSISRSILFNTPLNGKGLS